MYNELIVHIGDYGNWNNFFSKNVSIT